MVICYLQTKATSRNRKDMLFSSILQSRLQLCLYSSGAILHLIPFSHVHLFTIITSIVPDRQGADYKVEPRKYTRIALCAQIFQRECATLLVTGSCYGDYEGLSIEQICEQRPGPFSAFYPRTR